MKGNWDSLPAEIRLMILEDIARQRYHGWSSFAAVSQEWQAVFEPKNFHTLKLRISCLEEMGHMLKRRAHLVRHIWLHIELLRYTCRCCVTSETPPWTYRHNTIAQDAIVKLFSVLASWKPSTQLVLELSGYTPSDLEHWFHPRFFEQGTIYHDRNHRWSNGAQLGFPHHFTVRRLFSMFFHRPPAELPEVPAVTDLVLRRQFRRHMHPAGVRRIVGSLPQLQNFVYEPWRHCSLIDRPRRDTELATILQDTMKPGVKRVSILEDFNEEVESMLRRGGANMIHEEFNIDRFALAQGLASRSCSLQNLSVSYMLNACLFFHNCPSSYKWDHLQSLALTSPVLTPTGGPGAIVELLLAAGRAALRMPKLQDLALWNGKRGEACAFIYQKEKQSGDEEESEASLTWRGTWDFDLSDPVVSCWQKVANVEVKNERLQKDIIQSHGDAIYHLRLPRDVIDPESLRQIRQEGRLLGGAGFHGVIGEVAD